MEEILKEQKYPKRLGFPFIIFIRIFPRRVKELESNKDTR